MSTHLEDVTSQKTGNIITENESIRRYTCTFEGCSAAFGKPSRLEQHVRVHTGEVYLFVYIHYTIKACSIIDIVTAQFFSVLLNVITVIKVTQDHSI